MTGHERYDEVEAKFKAGKISGFKANDKKYRLFLTGKGDNEKLCFYKGSSTRRGFLLTLAELVNFKEYIEISPVADEEHNFKMITKYRKLAEKNPHTNSFVESCLALPDTYAKWMKEGKKGLYEYGITTGNAIDGKIITMNRIARLYPELVRRFYDAYDNDRNYHSPRYELDGKDLFLEVQAYADGTVKGSLSLEYKGTGNGFYYIMINYDTFIGYDVD